MDPLLDVCVREPIMDPLLDVCVREPIMDPLLDVCVEPVLNTLARRHLAKFPHGFEFREESVRLFTTCVCGDNSVCCGIVSKQLGRVCVIE